MRLALVTMPFESPKSDRAAGETSKYPAGERNLVPIGKERIGDRLRWVSEYVMLLRRRVSHRTGFRLAAEIQVREAAGDHVSPPWGIPPDRVPIAGVRNQLESGRGSSWCKGRPLQPAYSRPRET